MGRKASKPASSDNYLRAWREHRGLTQEKLGEMAQTTGAVIGLLETGERGLSDKWLRLLAPLLGTRPGYLLEVDPHDVGTEILEVWADIPEEDRRRLMPTLEAFRRPQRR